MVEEYWRGRGIGESIKSPLFCNSEDERSASSGSVVVSKLCVVETKDKQHKPSSTVPDWRDNCNLVCPRFGRTGCHCKGEGAKESLVVSVSVCAREMGDNGSVSV